jgi:hypothetical protein
MGAAPETVSVQIEIDSRRNILRATATGATELREHDAGSTGTDEETAQKIASASLSIAETDVKKIYENVGHWVFLGETTKKSMFGLIRKTRHDLRVLNREGVIKLQINDAGWMKSTAANAERALDEILEKDTDYGDGGATPPSAYIIHGARITDLSTIMEKHHIITTALIELKGTEPDEEIFIITRGR